MGSKKSAVVALNQLSGFLHNYLPIVNAHMVHFLTGNEWDNLDANLQLDLLKLDEQQLANLPDDFLNIKSKELPHLGPSLKKLMEDISSHSLASLNVLDDLHVVWSQLGIEPLSSMINFDKFMKVKKTHEVGALCDVIASLAKYSQCELILDLGCGKGALGSMISLNHDVYVCGIDAAGFNVHVEEGRQANIEKIFNADLKKNRNGEEPANLSLKKTLKFRRTTQFLSKDFNCDTVVDDCRDHFQQQFEHRIGIVGLHTCGNLASTSIELFVNSPGTRFLCNVGCCYHLIDEAYESSNCSGQPGFPISSCLKSKQFVLGRNARMVAAQPLERYASQKKLQPDVLFYRALLQVILKEKFDSSNSSQYQVGRLRKPVDNFVQYARWALGKLKLDIEITDVELQAYFDEHKNQSIKLHAYFQLRLLFAPLIEYIILLDRLAFLLEQEMVVHAFLVRIFSPVTSPRCYALMAFKEENE